MTVNCIAGRGTGTRGESRESVSERRRESTSLCGPWPVRDCLIRVTPLLISPAVALAGLALGPSGAGQSFRIWLCPAPVVIFYMRFTTQSTRRPPLSSRDSCAPPRGRGARVSLSVRVGGASVPRPATLGGRVFFVAGPPGVARPTEYSHWNKARPDGNVKRMRYRVNVT